MPAGQPPGGGATVATVPVANGLRELRSQSGFHAEFSLLWPVFVWNHGDDCGDQGCHSWGGWVVGDYVPQGLKRGDFQRALKVGPFSIRS